MLEKWADVVGYEGLYLVSESGEIKGVKSNKILKTYIDNGYYSYSITYDNISKIYTIEYYTD